MKHTDGISAVAKVFGITELLETILLDAGGFNVFHLGSRYVNGRLVRNNSVRLAGIKSLFVLQRVNKHFNITINGSKKLRRIMFRQDTDSEVDIVPVLNPLFFDPSSDSIIYPAILVEWRPNLVSRSFKGYRHTPGNSAIGLRSRPDAPLNISPTEPSASWRDLKLSHCAEERGLLVVMRMRQFRQYYTTRITTKYTLGEFAEKIIFGPIRAEFGVKIRV